MSRAGRYAFVGPYGEAPEEGFTPLSIANCRLWLKADTGITMDGGSRISAWADQSGQSNHATQATGALQPLYVADDAALNNHETVEFDQTRYMTTPSIDLTGNPGFTIAFVARRAASDPNTFVGLHRQASDAFSANGGNCIYTYLSNQAIYWANCQVANWHNTETGLFNPDTKHIVIARTQFSGGLASNASIRFDGIEATIVQSGFLPVATALPIWIGGGYSDGAGVAMMSGAELERIIYAGRITDDECGDLETYLSDRSGISI